MKMDKGEEQTRLRGEKNTVHILLEKKIEGEPDESTDCALAGFRGLDRFIGYPRSLDSTG